jgi:outer membrane lipoprotein SlyB
LPFVLFPGLLPLALAGCSEGYSPNTYASNAAQEEANVLRGVIIGVRQVMISADGTIGAAAGGAAGGVAGAQVSGDPVITAFGAIGGAVVGGIGGAAATQAVADTKGWEYIVQETGDKLVSVTQTSKTALPVGLHVLVIDGKQQARIVPDYTVQTAAAAPTAKPAAPHSTKTAAASKGSTTTEINHSPLPPAAGAAAPLQVAPTTTVASDPATPSAPPPASADPAAAPPAPSSTSGEAATPEAVNKGNSATGPLPVGSPVTSVQVAPGVSIPIPPVSSSSTAAP